MQWVLVKDIILAQEIRQSHHRKLSPAALSLWDLGHPWWKAIPHSQPESYISVLHTHQQSKSSVAYCLVVIWWSLRQSVLCEVMKKWCWCSKKLCQFRHDIFWNWEVFYINRSVICQIWKLLALVTMHKINYSQSLPDPYIFCYSYISKFGPSVVGGKRRATYYCAILNSSSHSLSFCWKLSLIRAYSHKYWQLCIPPPL